MRFLYDTAVFVYALGAAHPYREPCRRVVELARAGELNGEASIEMLQEFAHVRLRRTGEPRRAQQETRAVTALCSPHPVQRADLDRALELIVSVPTLDMRDAVHAASALNRGIPAILATDRAFEDVADLERIDPVDAPERLARR